jgi:hypothetical protein
VCSLFIQAPQAEKNRSRYVGSSGGAASAMWISIPHLRRPINTKHL